MFVILKEGGEFSRQMNTPSEIITAELSAAATVFAAVAGNLKFKHQPQGHAAEHRQPWQFAPRLRRWPFALHVRPRPHTRDAGRPFQPVFLESTPPPSGVVGLIRQ